MFPPAAAPLSVLARAGIYADVDGAQVARSTAVERTVRQLLAAAEAAHPEDAAACRGGSPGVDGADDAHLEGPRFFLLDLALRVYAEASDFAHLDGRRFADLTGSCGAMAAAASLLLPFSACVTLEPLQAGRVIAHELARERDKRHIRRKRRILYKGRGDPADEARGRCADASTRVEGTAQADPPQIEVMDCGRLFKNDWHDVDVALFDATRPAFATFVDEGALVRDVLRPGLAAAVPGTVVVIVTRDPNPTMRRALPFPRTGPAACELLDTCVVAAGPTHPEALRADVLRVIAASADPRLQARADKHKAPLMLKGLQESHRARLTRAASSGPVDADKLAAFQAKKRAEEEARREAAKPKNNLALLRRTMFSGGEVAEDSVLTE